MGEHHGFAVIPCWLLRHPDVSQHAKMVFLVLSARVDEQGIAFPSQSLMAEEIGCSIATVKRAVHDLREFGILHVTVERTPAGRRNCYRLLVDRFDKAGVGSQ